MTATRAKLTTSKASLSRPEIGPPPSVLFAGTEPDLADAAKDPEYFGDLHLDNIVAAVIGGRERYDLAPFFRFRLHDADTIAYRHEIFRDLESAPVLQVVRTFTHNMLAVRQRLERFEKAHYRFEKERWHFEAGDAYRTSVEELRSGLAATEPQSRGLRAIADYLADYTASASFTALASDSDEVRRALESVRYRLRIDGGDVVVGRYTGEPDYGADVIASFEKFRQGTDKTYEFKVSAFPEMNHVEDAIVERVALLYPQPFKALSAYHANHLEFLDSTVARFEREVQFYVAYAEHMARFTRGGLAFCYPQVAPKAADLSGMAIFDLALANVVAARNTGLVTNDFELHDPERVIVVSGPNQGGKTTFARTIGQLHHLAAIGVPVPGSAARLQLVDHLFAHFERMELVEDLASKLEDDLRRMRGILAEATSESLLVMNESFSSTTIEDQLVINEAILRTIIDCRLLSVVVTFLDELSRLGPQTVSMVSTVDPEEPAKRTFKIVRRPADGLAYALAIAEKHQVTYRQLKKRLDR